MKLTLTRYIDASSIPLERGLEHAVAAALDAAAQRVNEARDDTQTERIERGLRVKGGLALLVGSEIRTSGTPRLTAIEVAVPWCDEDKGSPKLWAANRFATVLADTVRLAS